jgi:hypothetical protein
VFSARDIDDSYVHARLNTPELLGAVQRQYNHVFQTPDIVFVTLGPSAIVASDRCWWLRRVLTTKTKPLRKQRSKSQVSEVFRSVSIDLYAKCVDPDSPRLISITKSSKSAVQVFRHRNSLLVANNVYGVILCPPNVRQGLKFCTLV